MDKPNIPRGLRNNNPLNIIRSPQCFRGEKSFNTDPKFKAFTNPALGYRAAFCIIRTYVQLRDCKTLHDIISRWCPDLEVITAYVDFVSEKAGVPACAAVNLFDKDMMVRIVSAMSHFENGVPAVFADVSLGWDLCFRSQAS